MVLTIVLVVFKREEDWSVSCYKINVLTLFGLSIVLCFSVVISPALFYF